MILWESDQGYPKFKPNNFNINLPCPFTPKVVGQLVKVDCIVIIKCDKLFLIMVHPLIYYTLRNGSLSLVSVDHVLFFICVWFLDLLPLFLYICELSTNDQCWSVSIDWSIISKLVIRRNTYYYSPFLFRACAWACSLVWFAIHFFNLSDLVLFLVGDLYLFLFGQNFL